MKGPKGQRGSAKSPIQIMRSKSPAESSESIIISTVTLRVSDSAANWPDFGVKTIKRDADGEQLLDFYWRILREDWTLNLDQYWMIGDVYNHKHTGDATWNLGS